MIQNIARVPRYVDLTLTGFSAAPAGHYSAITPLISPLYLRKQLFAEVQAHGDEEQRRDDRRKRAEDDEVLVCLAGILGHAVVARRSSNNLRRWNVNSSLNRNAHETYPCTDGRGEDRRDDIHEELDGGGRAETLHANNLRRRGYRQRPVRCTTNSVGLLPRRCVYTNTHHR